ncbi:MAG: hypothetical protein GX131_08100 [candidate division WS1 bacterium]|nr:hypothetical protein [candidate division WS1 bacterium]
MTAMTTEARPPTETPAVAPRPSAAELLLVTLLAAALWAGYLARTDFHLFPRDDVMQAVSAARQLAAGEGFTTRVAEPPMLVFLREQGVDTAPPWPSALRAPLSVGLIGLLMPLTGEPLAVALSSGIFFILSVPVLYLVSFRLAGRPAAILAAAVYVLSPAGLYLGSSGLTESSTIFALSVIVLMMMRPITPAAALTAGLAAGIGYLGRSTMTMWAVLIVLYILWMARDAGWLPAAGRVVLFCIPLAAAVWWWGAQMEAQTGEFGYSAQEDISIRRDTGLYPGRSSSLALEHWTIGEFVRAHPGVMASKYARIAEATWPQFITMDGLTLIVALFVAEFVIVLAGGKRVDVQWLVYLLIAQQLLMVPLASLGHGGVSANRYLDPFGPIAATFGAAFAVELVRRYGASMRRATLPFALLVALLAVPVAMDAAVGRYHGAAMEETRELAAVLLAQGEPDDVIASTHHAWLSWATNMYTVGLPITPAEFLRMDEELLAADWVHLKHRGETNEERTSAWTPIMEGRAELPGFELVQRFEGGSVLLRRAGD